MDRDDDVLRALATLAAADARRQAPPHLERAVLDAFVQGPKLPRPSRLASSVLVLRLGMTGAVAVLVVIGVAYVGRQRPRVESPARVALQPELLVSRNLGVPAISLPLSVDAARAPRRGPRR